MVGWRVRRGFRRLGIVSATPFAIGAVAAVVFYALQDPINQFDPALSAACLDRLNPFVKYACFRNPEPLYWAGTLSFIAGALFLACVGVGWVLAGFARDERAI